MFSRQALYGNVDECSSQNIILLDFSASERLTRIGDMEGSFITSTPVVKGGGVLNQNPEPKRNIA